MLSLSVEEFVGEEVEVKPIDRSGWYYITEDGSVISVKSGRPQVLNGWTHVDGYNRVSLYLHGGKVNEYAHRLVAFAFIPGYFPGAVVNHKNGDKLDNRVVNLEWLSIGDNVRHAHENGLRDLSQPNRYYD